ncbi:MAG: amidohydrolase [Clostridiales bacterium]|nr:amidohydrolase [Clostridiales bacterium]
MKIDIHNHPMWYNMTPERFVENMDKYGIDKTVLLSWETPEDEYDTSYRNILPLSRTGYAVPFEYCLSTWEKYPDRFYLGYAPDPRHEDAIPKLISAVNTYGVKLYGEMKLRMMFDNPDALRMYRKCAELGLAVLVHIDYEFPSGQHSPRPNYWYGGGIEALGRACEACPETTFIGHAPGFWAHISGDGKAYRESYPKGKVEPDGLLIRYLDKYPNLMCDISAGSGCNALRRDPEFAVKFLTAYQDRVLYGRDYFDNQHQEFLESIDLPDDIREKIYHKNAEKVLKL